MQNLVSLQNILDNISFAVLFITMLIYWAGAAFPNISYLTKLGTIGMIIANMSIFTLLAARWLDSGYFPLSNLYESLFFLAWGVTLIHLIAQRWLNNSLIGVFTSPVAMGITAFAALTLPPEMQSAEPLVPALKSNWLMMHVSVMMLSYSTLMVGSLIAIAFLVITRGQSIELKGSSVGTGGYRDFKKIEKQKEEGKIETIQTVANTLTMDNSSSVSVMNPQKTQISSPAMLSPQKLTIADTLDNLSYRLIGLGFPLLTIGIIAGGVWANEAWGSYWSWDPKETWAFITWLVFAAYLHARITKGWQGRKPAILASTGLIVVWICYLGVNLLGKGLHSYGWFF